MEIIRKLNPRGSSIIRRVSRKTGGRRSEPVTVQFMGKPSFREPEKLVVSKLGENNPYWYPDATEPRQPHAVELETPSDKDILYELSNMSRRSRESEGLCFPTAQDFHPYPNLLNSPKQVTKDLVRILDTNKTLPSTSCSRDGSSGSDRMDLDSCSPVLTPDSPENPRFEELQMALTSPVPFFASPNHPNFSTKEFGFVQGESPPTPLYETVSAAILRSSSAAESVEIHQRLSGSSSDTLLTVSGLEVNSFDDGKLISDLELGNESRQDLIGSYIQHFASDFLPPDYGSLPREADRIATIDECLIESPTLYMLVERIYDVSNFLLQKSQDNLRDAMSASTETFMNVMSNHDHIIRRGFMALRKIFTNNLPTDPLDIFAMLHMAYVAALVVHQDSGDQILTDIYAEVSNWSLAIQSSEQRANFIHVAHLIWPSESPCAASLQLDSNGQLHDAHGKGFTTILPPIYNTPIKNRGGAYSVSVAQRAVYDVLKRGRAVSMLTTYLECKATLWPHPDSSPIADILLPSCGVYGLTDERKWEPFEGEKGSQEILSVSSGF